MSQPEQRARNLQALAKTRMAVAPSRPMAQPPTRRAYMPGRALGLYVPTVTKKAFEKYGFATSALLTDWVTIAGADLASYTQPDRLKWPRGAQADVDPGEGGGGRQGATLMLRVDGPRSIEVQCRHSQIIDRINAYFGYRAIAELRIIQAPIDRPAAGNPARKPSALTASIPAGDGLSGALARLAAGIATKPERRA